MTIYLITVFGVHYELQTNTVSYLMIKLLLNYKYRLEV